jgi:beta-glucosidase
MKEWQNGYDIRFGVTHVNYETLERTPRKSARYLKSTFEERMATKAMPGSQGETRV